MNAKIIFLTIALIALHSAAVSRVGGGKVRSNSSGFEIQIPNSYNRTTERAETVTVLGPNVYVAGQGLLPEYVTISDFHTEFPNLVQYSPEQLQAHLTARSWEVVPLSSDSCVYALRFASSQVIVYALTWGNGKGVVLKAPQVGQTENAIKQMLSTLALDAGSCAWN